MPGKSWQQEFFVAKFIEGSVKHCCHRAAQSKPDGHSIQWQQRERKMRCMMLRM